MSPSKTKPKRHNAPTSFRLSALALERLAELAARRGISQRAMVELLIWSTPLKPV